jgi:hypothetical protein
MNSPERGEASGLRVEPLKHEEHGERDRSVEGLSGGARRESNLAETLSPSSLMLIIAVSLSSTLSSKTSDSKARGSGKGAKRILGALLGTELLRGP